MRTWIPLVLTLSLFGCPGDDGGDDKDGPTDSDGADTDGGDDTEVPGDTDDPSDTDSTAALEPRFVFAKSDEPIHSGDLNDAVALFAAPYDADDAPDLAAATQLSTGVIAGYDDYGVENLRPQVSPDGLWVAWIETSDSELYIAPVDGSAAPRLVSEGTNAPTYFAWSPDSSTIAFVDPWLGIATIDGAYRDCGMTDGYVDDAADFPILWAPDGGAVELATTYQDGDDWFYHHWVCSVTGSDDAVDLTPTEGSWGFAFGSGGRVAYAAGGHVYVDDLAGGAPTDVGAGTTVWGAPDGSHFVYVEPVADNRGKLMSAPWDGSTTGTAVSASTTVPDFQPVWFGPNADHIAFADADGLRVAALDGSVDLQVHDQLPTTGYSPRRPRWSPDGARIAFATFDSGDLYVARADTADSAQLACDENCSSSWAWIGDDTLLYYSSEKVGTWSPVSLRATGPGDTDTDLNALVQRNWPNGKRIRKAHWLPDTGVFVVSFEPTGEEGDDLTHVAISFKHDEETGTWRFDKEVSHGFFDWVPPFFGGGD